MSALSGSCRRQPPPKMKGAASAHPSHPMMSAGLAPWKLLNSRLSELHWLLTGTLGVLQCGQLPTEQASKRDWAPRWKSQSFHNWILVWYWCPITFAVSHSLGRDGKCIQQQRKRTHIAVNQGGRSLWATLVTACYCRANGADVMFHSWVIRVSLPLRQRAAKDTKSHPLHSGETLQCPNK